MTRKILFALLIAAIPVTQAVAGTVEPTEHAALRGGQGVVLDGYAKYVGDRWQPITIHLDQSAGAAALLTGIAAPRRVGLGSAVYSWTQGRSASQSSPWSVSAYGSGNGHRWFEDDDDTDFPVRLPAWHGHGHWHGHDGGQGDGGESGEGGGGVSAVPLPASFPLLLTALALLGLTLRRARA